MSFTGTRRTKYSPAKDGPFRCDHCSKFEPGENECTDPEVGKDPQVPKNSEGEPVVDPGGCCEYFQKLNKAAVVKQLKDRDDSR